MTSPTAADLIRALKLEPLPWEGGYYRETWRAAIEMSGAALPAVYTGPRSAGTAIYYLLTPETVSRLHRLPSDEVFHFYLGDPVELMMLRPSAGAATVILGPDIFDDHHPQFTVPGGTWFGARLRAGFAAGYALMGTTVSPGFDFDDLEMGDADTLTRQFPDARDIVVTLT